MKALLMALRSSAAPVGFRVRINILLISVLTGLLTGCSPGIDFGEHGENTLAPPGNIENVTYGDGRRMRQIDCGQLATYQITGVEGMMGVLTIHTNRSQAGANAPHCSLKVKIVMKNGDIRLAARDTITRVVEAGESMTEVTNLNRVNHIEVILKCEGEGNACIFSDPVFHSGRASDEPNERYAEATGNPLSSRVFTSQGANRCLTNEIVLHKIYLDQYGPENVGLEMVAVSACQCPAFVASVQGKRGKVSTHPRNGRANTISVAAFGRRDNVVVITGKCTGNAPSDCVGDADIKIVGKPL